MVTLDWAKVAPAAARAARAIRVFFIEKCSKVDERPGLWAAVPKLLCLLKLGRIAPESGALVALWAGFIA